METMRRYYGYIISRLHCGKDYNEWLVYQNYEKYKTFKNLGIFTTRQKARDFIKKLIKVR